MNNGSNRQSANRRYLTNDELERRRALRRKRRMQKRIFWSVVLGLLVAIFFALVVAIRFFWNVKSSVVLEAGDPVPQADAFMSSPTDSIKCLSDLSALDTAVPADTTVPPPETTTTTTTAAATTATTTTTTTTAEIPLVQTEDVEDIEDDIDEDTTEDTEEPEDDVIPEDDEAETTTTAAETVPEETTVPATVAGPAETTQEEAPRENNEIFTVNAGGTIVTDTALNIVSAAVMAEISDVFDDEAIKAQAIAAYTYIKYYNMNGQNAYIAKATPSEKVRKLVSQVIGKAMYYNGSMIQSVYTASTAGRSATAKNVWGIDYPYLQGKDTSFIDKEYDINYGRKATFTADEMKKYVKDSTGIVLTGDPSQWFKIESYFDEIFVAQMSIGGYTTFNNGTRDVAITGRVFRETIMNYDIRSYCFTIDYDADSDSFTITTYGYGHCVGMSQHGANILASKYGYNYEQILKFYYQGIEIK